VTCSSETSERLLRLTQQNLGNFMGYYSGKGKSHKKSQFRIGTLLALTLIDGRLS